MRLDPHTGKNANIDLFIASNHYQNKEVITGPDFGSDHNSIMLHARPQQKEAPPVLLTTMEHKESKTNRKQRIFNNRAEVESNNT